MPPYRRTALAVFARIDDAAQTVSDILAAGILPTTMELMDATSIRIVQDFAAIDLPHVEDGAPVEALLIFEVDGDVDEGLMRNIERIAEIALRDGAAAVRTARTQAETDDIWRARKSISGAVGRLRPDRLGEDICVPRDRIPDMVRRITDIADRYHLVVPIWGHAGDGNLHPNMLFDRRDSGEWDRVRRAAADIFRAALELGGTLSGEHGIGLLKREFLADDISAPAIDVMLQVKAVLDPNGILNPGKIFPGGDPIFA
jgi:glycolate oxidase